MKMDSFWLKIQKNSVIKGDSYSQLFKGTYIKKKKSDVTKNRKELIKNLMRQWQVKLSVA